MKALLITFIFLFHPMTLANTKVEVKCDREASAQSIDYLKDNIEIFVYTAMKQNISPVALVGTILAAQNFRPVSMSLRHKNRRAIGWNHSTGRRRHRIPSSTKYYGPARVRLDVISELEKQGDKNVEDLSLEEILNDRTQALEYTAKYLSYIGKIFAKNGQENVADRADLMATVFSQGSAQQMAQEQAYKGERLDNNDWGVFVNCHRDKISEIFKYLRTKGDHVLIEEGCVVAPKSAKAKKNWKYRCMSFDGTYTADLTPESDKSGETQMTSLQEEP